MLAPYVSRGLAHIASYLAEPQHGAAWLPRQVLLVRAHADTTEYSRSSSPATGQPSVTGGMTSASCYSARSAVIGSILAARHAGTKAAASATDRKSTRLNSSHL